MTIFKRPRQSMRRRFFAPFMCVVLCAITTATVHAETLDVRTKEFKPFAFEQNGKWVGFSLDLWEEVAKELGVQSNLKGEKSVSELLKTVSSKKADFSEHETAKQVIVSLTYRTSCSADAASDTRTNLLEDSQSSPPVRLEK